MKTVVAAVASSERTRPDRHHPVAGFRGGLAPRFRTDGCADLRCISLLIQRQSAKLASGASAKTFHFSLPALTKTRRNFRACISRSQLVPLALIH